MHGWKLIDFHSRCDDKGPTICLFKTDEDQCIGGYTETGWSSPKMSRYYKDKKAMLFNLTCERQFPTIRPDCAIWRDQDHGPRFGDDELSVYGEDEYHDEGFNSER